MEAYSDGFRLEIRTNRKELKIMFNDGPVVVLPIRAAAGLAESIQSILVEHAIRSNKV